MEEIREDDGGGQERVARDAAASHHGAGSPAPDDQRIVRHIMVIGFHHKHGYQVDYCYPPLVPGGPVFSTAAKSICLPTCWKTLPLLCLPDGSHNYTSDTIYFTMPAADSNLQQQQQQTDIIGGENEEAEQSERNKTDTDEASSPKGLKTIFGTACYRQIQADKLLNRTDDMTRVTVQKSVCVLSTKPLFGLIRSKLEMITHAYFEELDFSKVDIIKLTYENLNTLLVRESVKENGIFLGLSARHLVSQFGCNVLVLFKAIMLEKKILFYKSPVRDLCSTLMSVCSLFTGLLECGGLDYSTCALQLNSSLLEALKLLPPLVEDETEEASKDKVFFDPNKEQVILMQDSSVEGIELKDLKKDESVELDSTEKPSVLDLNFEKDYEVISDIDDEMKSMSGASLIDDPVALKLCRMPPEACGLPLQIFTRGSFCLPYLSISYLDLLTDQRIKSYVIGATNFLFKQRRELYDVLVDMEENTIVINDPQLKKCLTLTTEDLRFMDYLNKHVKLEVSQPKDEFDLISHDITKWVGGDEWIRYHFRLYTLYLLKASKSQSATIQDTFNSSFMQLWKQTTTNYNIWNSSGKQSVLTNLPERHPFSSTLKGPLNFSDIKLKLSYAVNNSEKGRMINQTLSGIGKWSIWNNIATAATAATTVAANTLGGSTGGGFSQSNSADGSNTKSPNSSNNKASQQQSNIPVADAINDGSKVEERVSVCEDL